MKTNLTKGKFNTVIIFLYALILLYSPAQAAPWTPPTNIRIVQKSNIDNTRVFDSIQSAIDSITGASETNPFIVKIMPGIYNESIRMKSFISLMGSGQDNTIIKSLSVADSYTILSAADSSHIENLMVTYNGTIGGFGDTGVIKIQGGAKVDLKDVKIEMPTNIRTLAIAGTNGLIPGASATLNNVYIYHAPGGINTDPAINLWSSAGKLTIYNSKFELYEAEAAIYGSGTVEIHDTSFLITANGGWTELWDQSGGGVILKLYNCTATISATDGYGAVGQMEIYNSKINVLGSGGVDLRGDSVVMNSTITGDTVGLSVTYGGNAKINNSIISGGTIGIQKLGASFFKIGNSQIIGGHNGSLPNDRVINCYDGDYITITDIQPI